MYLVILALADISLEVDLHGLHVNSSVISQYEGKGYLKMVRDGFAVSPVPSLSSCHQLCPPKAPQEKQEAKTVPDVREEQTQPTHRQQHDSYPASEATNNLSTSDPLIHIYSVNEEFIPEQTARELIYSAVKSSLNKLLNSPT